MKAQSYIILFILAGSSFMTHATDNARPKYQAMTTLQGECPSPAGLQQGKATQHGLVEPLIGTDTTAMKFNLIGKGSTAQENLLAETEKEMVTIITAITQSAHRSGPRIIASKKTRLKCLWV